jgi:hypothetical protein
LLCRFVLLSDEFGALDYYHLNIVFTRGKAINSFYIITFTRCTFFSPLIRMWQFFSRIFETPFYEGGKFEVPTNRLRKNVAASV